MSFAAPNTLLILLIILPLVWYIGYPRLPFRKRRDTASLIIRTVLMILIVLAVAGIQIVRQVDRLAVVFLVDASDSIGTELRDAQREYIENAVVNKPVDDEWAIVVFGANATIDTPFINVTDVPLIQSTVLSNNTDIEEALQTGISLFPANARRRIVVLSDGIQTIGNAGAKARLAEASGVEISYVLFAREASADTRITQFTAPARVNEGQEFDITVSIESDVPTEADLLIYSNNRLIGDERVSLSAGNNNYSLPQVSDRTGFLNFTAQLIVDGENDRFIQNNVLGTFSQVEGEPSVLLIATNPDEIVNLLPALENAGFSVDVVDPVSLPADTGELAFYESIIIANVPATALLTQMESIQTYVRDLGGGLVFVGGPESYGPGGYYRTTMEEILPVETQIRDQERLPQLTIGYLVDSSGSMGISTDGIFSNLDVAKRSVNLSIELLQPTDRAGVLTFDADGALVAPFQDVNDRALLQQQVDQLGAGGGTDILAGLLTSERYMLEETSDLKHLILITDGGSSPRNLVSTAGRLNQELGITLSVIAIGTNPPGFLREMTEISNGNYHVVRNISQIPNILAQETVLATRSYIEEGDIQLTRVSNNPMLSGIGAVPNLRGYVATTERNTAQVALRSPEPFGDPILTTWQYGLGRTVAFAGDANGRWGANWVAWDDFSRFWGQVVDYSITENALNNIETRVNMVDGVATITVDARSDRGNFVNNLALNASIVSPTDQSEIVRLRQTAPGQYAAEFEPQEEGAYYLVINGTGTIDGEAAGINDVTGWVMSYSPEYAITMPDEALLNDLANITGGSDLADDPAGTFITTQAPRTATAPIWQWMILAVMILLPIDIAVRRIILTRRDWQRFRAWVSGGNPDDVPEARMSTLMAARDRAREKTGMGVQEESTISALRRTRDKSSTRQTAAPSAQPDLQPSSPSRPARDVNPPPAQDSLGTVSNLLKRRRGEDEDE